MELAYLAAFPDRPTVENMTVQETAWEAKFQAVKRAASPLPTLPPPGPSSQAAAAPDSTCQLEGGACATLLIPGYAGVSSPGNGDLARFDDMVAFLEDPQTETVALPACCTNTIPGVGDVYKVDIYGGACNSDLRITNQGSHLNWLSSGHQDTVYCNGSPTDTRQHSKNTRIEHLSFHLAWLIYNEFPNTKVDIVAHSMGGVLVRYMIGQVQAENPQFPPELDIEDVFTFGTPHGGLYQGCYDVYYQGYQLCPDSGFMDHLRAHARSPTTSVTAPTFWTVVGSACDEVVSKGSSWDMEAGWMHAFDGASGTNDCPSHSGYYDGLYHSQVLKWVPQWIDQRPYPESYDPFAVGLGTRMKYALLYSS